MTRKVAGQEVRGVGRGQMRTRGEAAWFDFESSFCLWVRKWIWECVGGGVGGDQWGAHSVRQEGWSRDWAPVVEVRWMDRAGRSSGPCKLLLALKGNSGRNLHVYPLWPKNSILWK